MGYHDIIMHLAVLKMVSNPLSNSAYDILWPHQQLGRRRLHFP